MVTTSCFHLLGLNQRCPASGQGQPSKGSTAAPANAQRPTQQGQCLGLQRALCVPFSYHLPLELLKVSRLSKTLYEGKCV